MSIDHEKLLKRTEDYIASGQIGKAVGELLKLLEVNPEDINLMNNLGDVYLKAERQIDAIDMFKRAAFECEKNALYDKAIAIYQKALHIEPDTDIASRLTKLYQRAGMNKEAMQVHIQLVDMLADKGHFKKAIDEFTKLMKLDPQNTENMLKLADLHHRAGYKTQAVKIYLEVAESLAANNNQPEAYSIFERVNSIASTPPIFMAQARVYITQNDLNTAIKCLEKGLEANPKNIDLLEAKAKIELQLQQPIVALETLVEIPHLPEKLLPLCERALKMCPSEKVTQIGLEIFSDIAMEMTKRGLSDPVKNTLRDAIGTQPVPEYWLLLAEIASQEGSHSEHIYSLKRALDLLTPKDQRADPIRKMLSDLGTRLINPSNWWADPIRKKLSILGIVLEDLITKTPPAAELSPEKAAGAGDMEVPLQKLMEEAKKLESESAFDKAAKTYQKALDINPDNFDAIMRVTEFYKSSGMLTKAHSHLTRIAEKLVPNGKNELAVKCLDEAEKLIPGSTRVYRLTLGLVEAAPKPAEKPLSASQDRPTFPSKEESPLEITREDLIKPLPSPEPGRASETASGSPEYMSSSDISSNLPDRPLGEHQGAEKTTAATISPAVIQSEHEIFNTFKEAIDRQISDDDYNAHYNLAIAYKEMMLLDPAIEEFKKAMLDPKRTLECCSMLAMCEELKGDFHSAIEWLNRGVKQPGFPPIDSIGLRYYLAVLLKRAGRQEEAEALSQEIKKLFPKAKP